MDLPITAFKIKGNNEYIELTIDEVFGFPDETIYGGGYGAKGRLSIVSGCYNITDATHYFTTGELYNFLQELSDTYSKVKGTATLKNTEHELELECKFDKLGHVSILGNFRENQCVNNVLYFEFTTDQTQIKDIINQLEIVKSIFGDNCGIKKGV